jgi:hypothetical protein
MSNLNPTHRIRIFAKITSFWSPCIYARDVNLADFLKFKAAIEIIMGFTDGKISYTSQIV